jgi:hypothetical protein
MLSTAIIGLGLNFADIPRMELGIAFSSIVMAGRAIGPDPAIHA